MAECQVAAEQSRAGDLPAATATHAAALSAEARDWTARMRYQGAGAASDIAQYSGEPGAGRRAAERMLALALEAGDQWITLQSRFRFADHAAGYGDLRAAIALGLECVAALEAKRRPETLGMTLANLCSAYLQAGDIEAARAAAASALPLLRSPLYAGVLFNHIALIAVRDGDLSAAARLFGHSDDWYALYQTTRRQLTEAHSEEPAHAAIIVGLGAAEAQALLDAGGAMGDAGADALARQFPGRVGGALGAV